MDPHTLFLLATHALKVLPPVVWIVAIFVSALWLFVVTRVWSRQHHSALGA